MRPLVLAALLALVALPASAERRQFGNVVYDLPPDWSQGRSDEGRQVLLFDGEDDVCPYCSLSIGAGEPARGDLATWLRGQFLAFVDEEDRDAVEVLSGPDLVSEGGRTLAMMGQRVDDDVQMLFGFEEGGRFELVGFQGWAHDGEEAARTLAFLQSSVVPMIDALAFVSAGAAPVLPAAEPGSLDGLWWGWNQGFTLGLDGLMMPTMEYRTLAFWPDGRFYDGTPPGGLAPLDPAALAADTEWGTYREAGNTVELTFADGETERLARDGEGWSDGTRTLSPVETLPDGAMLDGTVSSSFYAALGPAGGAVSGGVSGSSETVFRPDGTFGSTRSSAAVGNFSDGAGTSTGGFATTGGGDATSGTYAIRDGLLTMTPSDGGEPEAEWAFVSPDGETMIGEEFLEPR